MHGKTNKQTNLVYNYFYLVFKFYYFNYNISLVILSFVSYSNKRSYFTAIKWAKLGVNKAIIF